MTEMRRTCIELDSPNVQLKLVGPGLVFCASDATYGTGYLEITADLAVRSLSARSVTVDPQDVPRFGEADPTKEFGTLPEMCAISAAVQGRSARYVYYSVPNDPHSFSPLHTVVRYDTKQRRITDRLVLENLGCDVPEELGSEHRQIHYLFMRGDGVLVALAGSAAVWVP